MAPHLSARLIRDKVHLEEILQRLREAGIRDAFVVAGDVEEPAGQFDGAAALLEAMAEIGHDLDEVGITGYPESHPMISDETTIQAMYDKAPYATYIVSQICFDPEVTSRLGPEGVATGRGAADPHRYARRREPPEAHADLGEHRPRRVGAFPEEPAQLASPDVLARWLQSRPPDRRPQSRFADPESNIQGFHIYTFNEFEKTEAWRREKLERVEET